MKVKKKKNKPLKIPSCNFATPILRAWSVQLDSTLPQLNNIMYLQKKSCLH